MLKFLGKGENFVYVACCIGALCLLYAFFTKNIPNGQYITDKVKVYDHTNEEYLYLNLVIDVENNGYYIREIVSPSTGKVIETDYVSGTFGKKCNFTIGGGERSVFGKLTSSDAKYSVTLNQSDISITALERIQNDFINFALRAALLVFMIYVTYTANRKKINE